MRELTLRDCEVVSGGFGPAGAVVNAIGAGVTYTTHSAVSGTGSWGGLALAVAGGAAMGFVTGPAATTVMQFAANTALHSILASNLGMATGAGMKMLDEAGTDYSGTNYQ